MKVFICEDDDGIVTLMRVLLQDIAHKVESTGAAAQALPKIRDFNPDVIIMDYWLLDGNSAGLVRAIRNQREGRQIPIILVSAIEDVGGLAQDLECDAALRKPFDIHEFQHLVQNLSENTYDRDRDR